MSPKKKGKGSSPGPHGYAPGTVHQWGDEGKQYKKQSDGKWKQLSLLSEPGELHLTGGHEAPRKPAGPKANQLDAFDDRPRRVAEEQDRPAREKAEKEAAEKKAEAEKDAKVKPGKPEMQESTRDEFVEEGQPTKYYLEQLARIGCPKELLDVAKEITARRASAKKPWGSENTSEDKVESYRTKWDGSELYFFESGTWGYKRLNFDPSNGYIDWAMGEAVEPEKPLHKGLLLAAPLAASGRKDGSTAAQRQNLPVQAAPKTGQAPQGKPLWTPQGAGRGNLQLVASPNNPSVKRWQQVNKQQPQPRGATLQEHLGDEQHGKLQAWADKHGTTIQGAGAVQAGAAPEMQHFASVPKAQAAFGELGPDEHHSLHEAHQYATAQAPQVHPDVQHAHEQLHQRLTTAFPGAKISAPVHGPTGSTVTANLGKVPFAGNADATVQRHAKELSGKGVTVSPGKPEGGGKDAYGQVQAGNSGAGTWKNGEYHVSMNISRKPGLVERAKGLFRSETMSGNEFEDLCKSVGVDPVEDTLEKGEPSQGPSKPFPAPPQAGPGATAPTPPGSVAPPSPASGAPAPAAPPAGPPTGPEMPEEEEKPRVDEDADKYPQLKRSLDETLDPGVVARGLDRSTGEKLAKLIEKSGGGCPGEDGIHATDTVLRPSWKQG